MIGGRLEQLSISRRRESCSEAWCCSRTPGGRLHHHLLHRHHRYHHSHHHRHHQNHHRHINSTIATINVKILLKNIPVALIIVIISSTNAITNNLLIHYSLDSQLNALPNDHLVYDHVTMRIPVSHDHFEQMEPALQKSFVLGANELVDGNLSKRRRNWWLTDSQLSKGRMGLVPLFEVLRVNFTEGSIQWGHNYHSHPLWYCGGNHHHQNNWFPAHVSFHHHPHQRHN